MLWGLAEYGGMKRAPHVFDGCKVEKWSDNITKWNERRIKEGWHGIRGEYKTWG
jgi:hypothetical protein